MAAASTQVTRSLEHMVQNVERLADGLLRGADQQRERARELAAAFEPLSSKLDAQAQTWNEIQRATIGLDQEAGAAESTLARLRTVLEQAGSLLADLKRASESSTLDERAVIRFHANMSVRWLSASELIEDIFARLKSLDATAGSMRTGVNDGLETQFKASGRLSTAANVASDFGRVAADHRREVENLRASAAALRRGMERLDAELAPRHGQAPARPRERAVAAASPPVGAQLGRRGA
jgi:hypothetical protein